MVACPPSSNACSWSQPGAVHHTNLQCQFFCLQSSQLLIEVVVIRLFFIIILITISTFVPFHISSTSSEWQQALLHPGYEPAKATESWLKLPGMFLTWLSRKPWLVLKEPFCQYDSASPLQSMNAVPGVPRETTLRREVGGAEDVYQSLTKTNGQTMIKTRSLPVVFLF